MSECDFTKEKLYHYHESAGSFGPYKLRNTLKPLHMCVESGWLEGVKLLIDMGLEINEPDFVVSNCNGLYFFICM